MKKNKSFGIVYQLLMFLACIFITAIFIWLYTKSGALDSELSKLRRITSSLDPKVIVTIVSTALTIISVLVEYIIAKFLLLIFYKKRAHTTELSDVLIPKTIVYILNIVILLLLSLNYEKVFSITSIGGAVLTFFLIEHKNKNIPSSLVFSAPFLIDTLYSGFKVFFL